MRTLLRLSVVATFALTLAACEGPPRSLQAPSARSGAGGGAGAGPSAGACDLTVPGDQPTIQAGVDVASPGDVVCVEPGTYEEDVVVNEAVTLQGRTAPRGGNPAVVDGRFSVEAGADGAAVRRFRITSSDTFPGGTFPDPFAVRVTAADVTVADNVIEGFAADLSDGEGSFTMHGVQVFGAEGAGVGNVTVRDNLIRNFSSDGEPGDWPKYGGIAAVKIQAGVEGATVEGNRIEDLHSAGWVWGVVLTPSGSAPGVPRDVTVEGNHVEGLNDGSVWEVFDGPNSGRDEAPYPGSAFGIDGTADAGEATVSGNSLLAPNGAESKDQDGVLVAECNWWGDRSGPTHGDNAGGSGTWALERGTATVEYTPWLNAPAPSESCVGGERSGAAGASGGG